MSSLSHTMLVIDDSTEQQQLYQNIFRQSQIRIAPIPTVDLVRLDGIIHDIKPSLIIVDSYTLRPHYTRITHTLSTTGANIPNAVVTTSCDNAICEAFDYVVLKPFTADALRQVVRNVLMSTDSF